MNTALFLVSLLLIEGMMDDAGWTTCALILDEYSGRSVVAIDGLLLPRLPSVACHRFNAADVDNLSWLGVRTEQTGFNAYKMDGNPNIPLTNNQQLGLRITRPATNYSI